MRRSREKDRDTGKGGKQRKSTGWMDEREREKEMKERKSKDR